MSPENLALVVLLSLVSVGVCEWYLVIRWWIGYRRFVRQAQIDRARDAAWDAEHCTAEKPCAESGGTSDATP